MCILSSSVICETMQHFAGGALLLSNCVRRYGHNRSRFASRTQWHKSVIPATWEVEAIGSQLQGLTGLENKSSVSLGHEGVQGQTSKSETLKIKSRASETWFSARLVKYSIHETLDSSLSIKDSKIKSDLEYFI